MTEASRECKNEKCNRPVIGRSDRLFCSSTCKADYHYTIRKESGKTYFKIEVDEILKKNRSILSKLYTKNGIEIPSSVLLDEGFNPRFFTHYWDNLSGDRFYFCYEFGFKEKRNNFGEKFTLIKWQKEMERQVLNRQKFS